MSDKETAWGIIMDEMDNEAKYAPSELADFIKSHQQQVANLFARIEALEFEVEHERYNVEKTAQEAAKRIKALEAALQQSVDDWRERGRRIEALEAALREIARFPVTNKNRAGTQMVKIAKGALEQSK